MDEALDKLQRIQQLYREMRQTKPKSPEERALLKKISELSAEYLVLIEAKTPKKPK